jgi:hypothetical protein
MGSAGGRSRRHDCQRSIAPRDAERIGAAGQRALDQALNILARREGQCLDAPFSREVGQSGSSRLTAPRSRIDQQHRVPGRLDVHEPR